MIDEAGAADRLRPEAQRTHKVTALEIEAVVAKMAKIPQKSVSAVGQGPAAARSSTS